MRAYVHTSLASTVNTFCHILQYIATRCNTLQHPSLTHTTHTLSISSFLTHISPTQTSMHAQSAARAIETESFLSFVLSPSLSLFLSFSLSLSVSLSFSLFLSRTHTHTSPTQTPVRTRSICCPHHRKRRLPLSPFSPFLSLSSLTVFDFLSYTHI